MNIKQLSFLMGTMWLPLTACAKAKPRAISAVAPVVVECPVGTAPRLPYAVWVTYSDGYAEYRQVRWSNSALSEEHDEASATLHPVGTTYSVDGYVTGDDTTEHGYPIAARVSVTTSASPTPTEEAARTFPLADVALTGDNRLTLGRDLLIGEACSWDVTQQLYNYRDTYGLPTEGYTTSDGWDSPDTKLKGHGSGHYMSAIAQAYAVATDPEQKAILRKNITRMVNELRQCQERTFVYCDSLGRYWEARDLATEEELPGMKGTWDAFDEYKKHPERYGYGYINAIPAQHCALIEMYRPYNNSDWVWAPYYSIHKQLAGLLDIAAYFDNKAVCDKALLVAKDMGLWVWNRMHYRTYVKSDGTQDERRQRPGNRYEMWDMYIAGEVGGMQEVLARLAETVTDKEEKARLMEAAGCFDAPKFYNPLSRNIDDIRTRHANQHIPMVIGALRCYKNTHEPYYYDIAENFWTLLQGRYTYATGGVGNGEMFRQPYTQTLSMATNGVGEGGSRANPDLNETCCAYNLLKLTRDLNRYSPDDARYMDYYERTLYNQIVGSLNPEHYQTCYQYAVGLNATKPFGNETPQSTCCGGTGAENHTKYQEAAYFHNDSTLWVALYMPTTLLWREKGVSLSQDCQWPAQRSVIRISEGGGDFALKLRVPCWATDRFRIKVNGKRLATDCQPGTYAAISRRQWHVGDSIEVEMPFTKYIYYGPDKLSAEAPDNGGAPLAASWVGTVMYGPLAMTGTGVESWKDATLITDSRLGNVKVDATSEEVPALSVQGHEFLPDYYRNRNSTHYYRILRTDGSAKSGGRQTTADLTELKSLVALTRQRKASQEQWEAMEKKVPEHAPWAPYGYERMTKAADAAQDVIAKGRKANIEEVAMATASLNRAINTMRPGNLAETEDLGILSTLLRDVVDNGANNELHEAVDYGRMVVRYVTDGSGTHDMIKSAEERLIKALGR